MGGVLSETDDVPQRDARSGPPGDPGIVSTLLYNKCSAVRWIVSFCCSGECLHSSGCPNVSDFLGLIWDVEMRHGLDGRT